MERKGNKFFFCYALFDFEALTIVNIKKKVKILFSLISCFNYNLLLDKMWEQYNEAYIDLTPSNKWINHMVFLVWFFVSKKI